MLLAALVSGPASAQENAGTATPPASAAQAPGQPRNAVGDKFELPRVGKDNQVELISGLCGVQMKAMSKEACTCLAEQALDKLSDPQRDYLIASAVAPPVADRMLKDGRVGKPDQVLIFGFLDTTSSACATGTFKEPPKTAQPSGGAVQSAAPGAASQPQPSAPEGSQGNKPAN
ncbi:hypothetical protein [Mangrovicella endophytica]|uniref:hypothetical protein n=1 Tax=Mangrovicella endophytica TaxID=2066697 RepID=UPI000C9DEA8D|nr:hypothetical protein [Mangrovicella endophytica]